MRLVNRLRAVLFGAISDEQYDDARREWRREVHSFRNKMQEATGAAARDEQRAHNITHIAQETLQKIQAARR